MTEVQSADSHAGTSGLPRSERLWKKQYVSREAVARALSEAQLPLCESWAAHGEAVELTLACILTRAVRRQFLAHRPTIPARKYDQVAALARKFQDLLISLQATDDPPELLAMDERGRTQWETWALGSKGLEDLGANPYTDQYALLDLAGFFQLALNKNTPGFSRGKSPLAAFLEIAFRLARNEYHRRLANPELEKAHSLRPPDDEALVKYRRKHTARKLALQMVTRDFARYCAEEEASEDGQG